MPQPTLPRYIGRFAPSPSGPLHFGSLVCALASYLDAKARSGQWLLRIEDIDPPREQPGASSLIRQSLEAHHLYWDGEIRFQSARGDAYRATLNRLKEADLLYPCHCTRKRVAALASGIYDGQCRKQTPPPKAACALRLKVQDLPQPYQHIANRIHFQDRICGPQTDDLMQTTGDFIIHRKDGLFAYQLAVVVDDLDQGITDIVRGDDLLEDTAKQIFLFQLLGKSAPTYAHIPVIKDATGKKLSKQHHAPAINDSQALHNLKSALTCLNIETNETIVDIDDLLTVATQNWHLPRHND